ncbi:MAG: N-acetylmuramoyl-L-alanine amidase [Lachnospiraceae bacterium]|nr:N-acetylmuramoyl-L-alanine amidase [Lachnospiraceae bacterium]
MGTKGQWNGKLKRGFALLLTAAMILNTDLSSFAANISANSTTTEETSNQNTLVDILEEVSQDKASQNEVSQDQASQNEVLQDQPSQNTAQEIQEIKEVSDNQAQEVESVVGSGSMNLEVSCVTFNKAKLTWNAVNGADGYIISRKVSSLNGSSSYENIKTLNKNAKSFVDSRLLNGETYYYQVTAATKSGSDYTPSEVSAEVSVDMKIAAPLSKNSIAQIDKKNRVIIKWPKVAGAQQYKLSRLVNDNPDNPWESIIDTNKYDERVNPYKNNSYIDNVDAATDPVDSYVYQLVASRKDADGYWIDSEETIIVCTPSVLMANNDGDKDTMGVVYTSIIGCREYEVQRSFNSTKVLSFKQADIVSNTDGKVTSAYNGDRMVSASSNGIAVEKYLDKGGEYAPISEQFGESFFYRVRAVAEVPDGEGTKVVYSPYSKALKSTVTLEAPILVSVNCVSYNKANVKIKVSDITDIEANDCLVFYRSNKSNTGFKEVKRVKAGDKSVVYDNGNNTISYTLAGFIPEYTYYLKVAVIKRGYKSSARKTVNIQTEKSNFLLTKTVFDDLKKVTVKSANYNAMSVSFNKVPGATKYNVYYTTSIGNDKDESTWSWATKPITITNKGNKNGIVSYTKTGYKHGQLVAMYAVPISGKFEHQQTKPQLTPDKTRIKATTGIASSAGPWKITYTWNKVAGADSYQVEFADRSDFQGAVSIPFSSSGTTIISGFRATIKDGKYSVTFGSNKNDGTIVTGKPYYFRVTTHSSKDNVPQDGDISKAVSERARPKEVTNLTAEYEISNSGAKLNWRRGDGATGYRIKRSINNKNNYKIICDYTTSTSYTDTDDIKNGTQVYYLVYSVSKVNDASNVEWVTGSKKYVETRFCIPTKVTLEDTTIRKGESKTISLKYEPANATVRATTGEWKSSNTGIVTVKQSSDNTYSATIKGIKVGREQITVTPITSDKAVRCYVTVTNNLKVCLDPGHGGSDSGAVAGGYTEKERNLKIAYYTKERLEASGISVVMTRTGDYYVGLEDRTTIAKNNGCNLFVSQHLNSGGGTGTEVYYSINSTYARSSLASSISSRVASAIGTNNRGAKTRTGDNGDYYSVIRTAAQKGIPGIIVEGAFLDTEYGRLNDAGCKTIGYVTAEAIIDSFN